MINTMIRVYIIIILTVLLAMAFIASYRADCINRRAAYSKYLQIKDGYINNRYEFGYVGLSKNAPENPIILSPHSIAIHGLTNSVLLNLDTGQLVLNSALQRSMQRPNPLALHIPGRKDRPWDLAEFFERAGAACLTDRGWLMAYSLGKGDTPSIFLTSGSQQTTGACWNTAVGVTNTPYAEAPPADITWLGGGKFLCSYMYTATGPDSFCPGDMLRLAYRTGGVDSQGAVKLSNALQLFPQGQDYMYLGRLFFDDGKIKALAAKMDLTGLSLLLVSKDGGKLQTELLATGINWSYIGSQYSTKQSMFETAMRENKWRNNLAEEMLYYSPGYNIGKVCVYKDCVVFPEYEPQYSHQNTYSLLYLKRIPRPPGMPSPRTDATGKRKESDGVESCRPGETKLLMPLTIEPEQFARVLAKFIQDK